MTFGNQRQNHDFQIAYFIAGACHTPDGAYMVLCNQKAERERALLGLKTDHLRKKLWDLDIKERLESPDEKVRIQAEIDLIEEEANRPTMESAVVAAQKELEFINKCIEKIQPYRKYAHLSDHDAHEAAQHDEWKHELIYRAENFILTTGTIPHDHFATMRQHPDFKEEIYPVIAEIRRLMIENKDHMILLNNRKYDIPKLLELESNNVRYSLPKQDS